MAYQDEHLAWQQRVQKEITAASRFYNAVDSLKDKSKTHKSWKSKRKSPDIMTYQNLSPVRQNFPIEKIKDLSLSNIYAEVRGKYARMPIINPSPKFSTISRPTTSGSLIKYNRKPHERHSSLPDKIIEEDEEKSRPLVEEISYPKRKSITRDNQSPRSPKKKEIILPMINQKLQDSKKETIENKINEEKQDKINEEIDNEDEDTASEISFNTTSSQKKYIEELEQMLREERMKRIKLEEELESLKAN